MEQRVLMLSKKETPFQYKTKSVMNTLLSYRRMAVILLRIKSSVQPNPKIFFKKSINHSIAKFRQKQAIKAAGRCFRWVSAGRSAKTII